MRNAHQNQIYALELERRMPWPGPLWARLWGADEPMVIQFLRPGFFGGWETLYPADSNPQNMPYPFLFATVGEAKAAILQDLARPGVHGTWRIVGFHTGVEYSQVNL